MYLPFIYVSNHNLWKLHRERICVLKLVSNGNKHTHKQTNKTFILSHIWFSPFDPPQYYETINVTGTSQPDTNRERKRSHQTTKKKNHDVPVGKLLFLKQTSIKHILVSCKHRYSKTSCNNCEKVSFSINWSFIKRRHSSRKHINRATNHLSKSMKI